MRRICRRCGRSYSGSYCSRCGNSRREYQKEYRKKNAEKMKILDSTRWRKLRLKILERDGYVCQRCLIKYGIVNDFNLEVHHIKSREHYPDLCFDEDNLITVCKICNLQLGVEDKLDFKWTPPESGDYELF